MIRDTFKVLEELLVVAKPNSQELARLISAGKSMVHEDSKLQAYATEQCRKADSTFANPLERNLLETLKIDNLATLWHYREAMAKICDYQSEKREKIWIKSTESNEEVNKQLLKSKQRELNNRDIVGVVVTPPSFSSLALCALLEFGYGVDDKEILNSIKKILEETKGSAEWISDEYFKASREKIDYAKFLSDTYPDFLIPNYLGLMIN